MKQRVVIRFFKPKGLKAKAIHAELESVYGGEALALPTVKKNGASAFRKEEETCLMILGREGP
jgi:hypothetical protein